jgi:hypothetical protein
MLEVDDPGESHIRELLHLKSDADRAAVWLYFTPKSVI